MALTTQIPNARIPPMDPEAAEIDSPTLLKIVEVCRRTTLSRAHIWRMVKSGTFPAPVKISTNRVAWYEHDVATWILSQRVEPT